MAIFRITPATSRFTSGVAQSAFADDTAGADTLIVDAGAHLLATGMFGFGAHLLGTLAWKVTINGSIFSEAAAGLVLAGSNTARSTITIGADGEVGSAQQTGIAASSAVNLTNAGLVFGKANGVMLNAPAASTLTNKASGTISGGTNGVVISDNAARTITNAGTISGTVQSIFDNGASNDTVKNTGTLSGLVFLGGGHNVVTNGGTINGNISSGGSTSIVNSGTINGSIALGFGTSTVKNSGTITGNVSCLGANDTIVNSKTINGVVNLGDGTNTLTNSGTIVGNVNGGVNADTVTNSGKGVVLSVVDLRLGDDRFTGGNASDRLRDNGGSDISKLGGGNDSYLAVRIAGSDDGTDSIDGGAGIDTYDASNASAALRINLDKVDHDLAPIGLPGGELVTKNTAIGNDVDGGAGTKDTVLNFENVKGGSGSDFIYGSATANVLEGNAGADLLFGFGGNDTLVGGDGADYLIGGAGRDILDGGIDGFDDRFIFTAISDSTVAKAGRDQIVNFEDGIDLIDLSRINPAGLTSFTYINGNSVTTPFAAFTGTAGELRSVWTASCYVIEGDVNGDGKADFAIDIVDPTFAIVLTSADFVL
jgi:serralysin